MSIHIYQFLVAVGWIVTAVALLPSFLRSLLGRPCECDNWKTVVFFAALLFAAFTGRRLLFADQFILWKLLYILGLGLIAYVWLLLWNWRHR